MPAGRHFRRDAGGDGPARRSSAVRSRRTAGGRRRWRSEVCWWWRPCESRTPRTRPATAADTLSDQQQVDIVIRQQDASPPSAAASSKMIQRVRWGEPEVERLRQGRHLRSCGSRFPTLSGILFLCKFCRLLQQIECTQENKNKGYSSSGGNSRLSRRYRPTNNPYACCVVSNRHRVSVLYSGPVHVPLPQNWSGPHLIHGPFGPHASPPNRLINVLQPFSTVHLCTQNTKSHTFSKPKAPPKVPLPASDLDPYRIMVLGAHKPKPAPQHRDRHTDHAM